MKPFNIKEYLENPDKKVVTRDGRNARIICTDVKGGDYPIVALIDEKDNIEKVYTFIEDGRWDFLEEGSDNDLFFASEEHEGWVNLYRCGDSTKTGHTYDSEEKAIELGRMNSNYLKTVKIEWEE